MSKRRKAKKRSVDCPQCDHRGPLVVGTPIIGHKVMMCEACRGPIEP